jgi:hypothetical protein
MRSIERLAALFFRDDNATVLEVLASYGSLH